MHVKAQWKRGEQSRKRQIENLDRKRYEKGKEEADNMPKYFLLILYNATNIASVIKICIYLLGSLSLPSIMGE